MKETLRPRERIRQKKDFLVLYKKGHRYRGRFFNLVYLSNELGFSRMAVVVSKKVGNAVQRNRIKRRMRALFRTNKDRLINSLDLIFIVKKEVHAATWSSLREDYLAALEATRPRGS